MTSARIDRTSAAVDGTAPTPRGGASMRIVQLAPLLVCAAYACVVLRRAWISDDAFITLRVLENVLQGYGLLSNPPERVLGFTHPLWALLLLVPRSLGLDGYWSAMNVSVLLSIGTAAFIVLRVARDRLIGALAGVWLAGSLAYVDFSTGGLENPLAHALLALFFSAFCSGRLAADRPSTFLLASLIVLDRHDHALLVLPALASLALELRPDEPRWWARVRLSKPVGPLLRAALLGSLPLLAWLAFALVYYGFPLPNTAYAKLNAVLPKGFLTKHGVAYFRDTLRHDPLTLVVIGCAWWSALQKRGPLGWSFVLGVGLYLAYVVRIGGDFMSGRFFTAPFVVAVVWLATRELPAWQPRAIGAALAASGLVIACFPTTLKTTVEPCTVGSNGIVSERSCYAEQTGLWPNLRAVKYTKSPRFDRGRAMRKKKVRVSASWNVGMVGFAAGPTVHVVDRFALTDPLLARIPYRLGEEFRIGHFMRELPEGYLKSLKTEQNLLTNPCLHAYYDVLHEVVRGPLFSRARWQAIAALNLGELDHLMRKRCPLLKPSKAKAKPRAEQPVR